MTKDEIKIFCPATIANISCGFDVLGLALGTVGDVMVIRRGNSPGIRITRITGQEIPMDADKNVAGVAGMAMLKELEYQGGFEVEIHKKIKAGSGIGSSAASASGVVWGINHLLGNPCSEEQLVRFAMEGEKLASGTPHADNVAPAIYGGITLVRSSDPLDVVRIHAPAELFASVVHPQIEIKTSDSRKILRTSISLADGIRQWGNLGALIAGLFREDYDLIGRSLEDHIVEPIRSILIPGFDEIKRAAIAAGALGCGISGSGPSIFALSKGRETAVKVSESMSRVLTGIDLEHDTYVSEINTQGIRIIS
ncbi:homoserine kinase [Muriicola jejuensis]|uniref:Homoserine kinase n=1 Tax=Muriicola jejuensis TaxID=504488 RepID=A0A6P0U8N2_9FLAO|nr:homoserine kinase [Muriicola jejuensis]NER08930.1 homoserine kinase [Muriicola jejuensis]SMP12806.1 homoserine kinase [Muriicola jejuensis]